MKIRNRILVYFSTTVIALTAVSFTIIYILFSEYREEEFQQHQNEKIKYNIKLLAEYKELSEKLADIMDELTIHDFYDEKMLVFDQDKRLIFSSIDDLPIPNYQEILEELSPKKRWYETKDVDYDVIGIYTENNNQSYYAISKAYDAFGYTKLNFLRNVLVGIFIFIVIFVVAISQFLSEKISNPITRLTKNLNQYDLSNDHSPELETNTSSYEITQLTERFNELLRRTNEAFAFQKHTVHHISHQLKTPIAVLVSELEKARNCDNIDDIRSEIQGQIIKAQSLGSIIDVLLEISKIESGQKIKMQPIRIDELIFDVIEELNIIHPDFEFEVNYAPDAINENKLIIDLNPILVKQAFQNLLTNCIAYSNNAKAEIEIDCTQEKILKIRIINSGTSIAETEEKFLFDHFFRGENSKGKSGFGLGLVLTKKVIELNEASISYSKSSKGLNIFELRFNIS